MSETKNIIRGTWWLLVSILLTGYQVIRNMVLPGRNRKGNVLGSLFLFFIETAQKIIAFEQDILHSSWLAKNRFAKQGLIIATAFLFLVSSVEWTTGNYSSIKTVETVRVEGMDNTIINRTQFGKKVTIGLPVKSRLDQYPVVFSTPFHIEYNPVYSKRFLLLRVLLI